MPFSRNLNTYTDVVLVLTAARERGGEVLYKLSSKGAAMNWRARAYNYRKLLVDSARARAGNIKGFVPTTDWDDMLLVLDGEGGVKISFSAVIGTLTDADGKEFKPTPIAKEPGDAERIISHVDVSADVEQETAPDIILEQDAEDLKKRLGL